MNRSIVRTFAATIACISFMTVAAIAAPGHTTGNVNIRSGPGANYQKITTLPAGLRIDVRRCVANWCNVRARGVSGWVAANYIQYSAQPVIISPTVIARPPHYRPPHYRPHHSHRPNRPRPPGWNKPGRPTCKIAPGRPCPR
ncbi:SH3 domain-containing protein [Brucella pituitosa]|uniref:SH3 domain-containing protein n=1 Tax=Brucella pituitosa TaxID=571256 RepID=UPI0031F3F546|nr:SH3 domain-containing protein [Brucella pituitosa]